MVVPETLCRTCDLPLLLPTPLPTPTQLLWLQGLTLSGHVIDLIKAEPIKSPPQEFRPWNLEEASLYAGL